MKRGDFGKAFAAYKKLGGTASRKDYANTFWQIDKKQFEKEVVVSDVERTNQ